MKLLEIADDIYQRALASMVYKLLVSMIYKLFDEKTRSGATPTSKAEVSVNEQLAEELHKPVFKKITRMLRRWGTLQNFFLAFTDELEKQLPIKKAVEVGQ